MKQRCSRFDTHACLHPSAVLLPAGFPAGVESFDVSLEQQRVVVRGNVTPQAVLETVAKTGKKAELVQ
jgi:copper chaperone